MMTLVKNALNNLLGRGDAAITVPPMDGPLQPNQRIESAEVVASFAQAQDLAFDGTYLWVADGRVLLRQTSDGSWSEQARYPAPITALCSLPGQGMAVAVGGDQLQFLNAPAWHVGQRSVQGRSLQCITALSLAGDGSLLATDSSASHAPDAWSRDLMEHGKSGRVCRLSPVGDADTELASGLRFPFGAIEHQGAVWASESWGHRLVALGAGGRSADVQAVLDRLPGYPSRISPASDGGLWLTVFTLRTRLVEFVLRERAYRERMLREVDSRYWICPALSSGKSFLEPLQGGSVKQLGTMKPWAPPRSYGLVVKLNAQGSPVQSLHSRADGVHHGIVAALEAHGHLYMLSKGAGRLLRVPLFDTNEKGQG